MNGKTVFYKNSVKWNIFRYLMYYASGKIIENNIFLQKFRESKAYRLGMAGIFAKSHYFHEMFFLWE